MSVESLVNNLSNKLYKKNISIVRDVRIAKMCSLKNMEV